MTGTMTAAGVPFEFTASPAEAWTAKTDGGAVTGIAGPRTDMFIDPAHGSASAVDGVLNAPTLLGLPPGGDFQFSARVTVDFAATFDAGVLLVMAGDKQWGKLCFELSPDGDPMIVSVVTRGVSDDANAFVVPSRTAWLRVSRIDQAFAYHASTDGTTWRLIRYFTLDAPAGDVQLGLEVQSPTGEGLRATFEDIRFSSDRLTDLRDGS